MGFCFLFSRLLLCVFGQDLFWCLLCILLVCLACVVGCYLCLYGLAGFVKLSALFVLWLFVVFVGCLVWFFVDSRGLVNLCDLVVSDSF